MGVRIVTNPGSNLSPAVVERYAVRLTPQRIVVDAEEHDTRHPVSHADIDRWVRTAKVHPYVVGTTAGEHAQCFRELVREGHEVLVVSTSRKVIKTHDAALSAARSVEEAVPGAAIRVTDSGVTDLGVALVIIMAGEALAAGRSAREVVDLIDAYAVAARYLWTVESLDYMVKGGRATALRAFLANLLRIRPLIGFVDGEVQPVGKMRTGEDPTEKLLDQLETTVPRGARIWLAVYHGDDPGRARALLAGAEQRYDVVFAHVQPLSAAIYLYVGKGTVGLSAVALDALPFQPPVPAPGL